MYNGAEIEESLKDSKWFGHKENFDLKRAAQDYNKEIQNGNLVVVLNDDTILKSEHIGIEYFKNNFERL